MQEGTHRVPRVHPFMYCTLLFPVFNRPRFSGTYSADYDEGDQDNYSTVNVRAPVWALFVWFRATVHDPGSS